MSLAPTLRIKQVRGSARSSPFCNYGYNYRCQTGGTLFLNRDSIEVDRIATKQETIASTLEDKLSSRKSWKDLMNQGLSVEHAQQVFDELIKDDQFHECLNFIQLSSNLGHNLNQINFHELLKQARTLTRAKELIRRLEGVGVVINSMGYTLILMAMEKERNLQDMVDLLEFMRLIGSPPNEVSYGVTINTASHLSDGVFAKNLLRDMILHGIAPSPPCYSGVLMACAKANMWDEVQQLLEEMLRQGNEVSEGMLIGLLFQIKSKVQSIKDNASPTGIQEYRKVSQLINELWGKAWWILDQFLSRAIHLTDYIFVVAMEVADVCDRPYDVYHVFELMKVYNIPVGKPARQWLEQACLRTRDHNLALQIVHDPYFNDARSMFLNLTMHLCSDVGDHFQTLSLIRQRLDFLRLQEEAYYFHRFSGSEFGLFANAIDNITSSYPFLLDPHRPLSDLLNEALSIYFDNECQRVQGYCKEHMATFRLNSPNVTLDDLARVTVFYDEMELGNDMTEDSQLLLMRIALDSNRWTALRRMTERFSHREYVEFMGFNQTRLFEMAGIYSRAHPNVGEYLHFNAHLMELLHLQGEESLVQLLFLQSMHRFLHPRDWLGDDTMAFNVDRRLSNASRTEGQENNSTQSEWSTHSWYLSRTKRTLPVSSWITHGYRCAALGFLRDGYPGYALALKDWMRQHQVEDLITNRLILLTLLRSPPPFLSKIVDLIENDPLISKDPIALVLGIEAMLRLTSSSPDIYERAIVYLRNLSSLGYPMTTEIINKVIAICVECCRPEEAKRLMETMEVFNIPRDNVTYHLVVESLIKANLWEEARALMQSTIHNADQFPLEPWVRSLYANMTYADSFEAEFTVYRDFLSPKLASNEKLWKDSRSSTKAKLPPAKGFGRKPSPKSISPDPNDINSNESESPDILTAMGYELWTTKDWDVAIRRHLSYQDHQHQSFEAFPVTTHPRQLYFQSLLDSLRAQKLYDHVDTLAAMYVLLGIVRRTSLLLDTQHSLSASFDEPQHGETSHPDHVHTADVTPVPESVTSSTPNVADSIVSYLQQQLRTKS